MVTMDQLLVDLGDVPAEADDEVVLIGRQGDDEITATEWGERLGTISYEIVTGIGARVPRTYVGDRTDERRWHRRRSSAPAWSPVRPPARSAWRTRPSARSSRASATATIPTPATPLVPEFDEARILDSHDGGTIYTISRGDGPPIVFCHGVTLSSRVWAKQFDDVPRRRLPRRGVRLARPRRVARRARPATRSTTSPTTCAPCSRRSTCAT